MYFIKIKTCSQGDKPLSILNTQYVVYQSMTLDQPRQSIGSDGVGGALYHSESCTLRGLSLRYYWIFHSVIKTCILYC